MAAVFTGLISGVVSVFQILNPSHVKDYVSKFKSKLFDHTLVYTDKNVELEGLKTSSVVTPEVLANVTEFQSDDLHFKASREKIDEKKQLLSPREETK